MILKVLRPIIWSNQKWYKLLHTIKAANKRTGRGVEHRVGEGGRGLGKDRDGL